MSISNQEEGVKQSTVAKMPGNKDKGDGNNNEKLMVSKGPESGGHFKIAYEKLMLIIQFLFDWGLVQRTVIFP